MINQTNYKPVSYQNPYPIYTQHEQHNPVVQFIHQPSPSKVAPMGGTTILRNGSNSYKPILNVQESNLQNINGQSRELKFKPLQRTIEQVERRP
jgi:hypothetical protein